MSKNQRTHIQATKKLNLGAKIYFVSENQGRDKIELQFAVPNVQERTPLLRGVPRQAGQQISARILLDSRPDPSAATTPPPKYEGPQTIDIYFDFDKGVSFRHPADLVSVLERARDRGEGRQRNRNARRTSAQRRHATSGVAGHLHSVVPRKSRTYLRKLA